MPLEILNKNVVIADKVKHYKNFFFKAKGLMFTRPLRKGQAIVLEAMDEGVLETTIHMLFVFYPIDIVWLNSNKEVVDLKESVLPFIPWIAPRRAAKYVIELKKGAAKHIRIGDRLDFVER